MTQKDAAVHTNSKKPMPTQPQHILWEERRPDHCLPEQAQPSPWEFSFDPTLALKRIFSCSQERLVAEARGTSQAMFFEALAQACGLHARFCRGFQIQAVLVSMSHVRLLSQGECLVMAHCQATTTHGALYRVEAGFLAHPCQVTIGLRPAVEPQTVLAQRFQCLLSPSSPR